MALQRAHRLNVPLLVKVVKAYCSSVERDDTAQRGVSTEGRARDHCGGSWVGSYGDERIFEQVRKMIRKITGIIFGPFGFFILLLVFLGKNIIPLAYGVEYSGVAHALLLVTAAIAVEAILFWSVSPLSSLGLVAVRFTIYLASVVAGFVIAFALTPTFGAVGMAITLLAVNIMVHGVFVGAAAKKVRKMHA